MKNNLVKILSFFSQRKILIFPLVITAILLTLTLLKIHGSSVGIYDYQLDNKDSWIIAGEPRVVRSDEWVVNTPFVISQSENNFPLVNKDVSKGQNMSLVIDVPYKDWSSLFKPQNLVFFILPFENAFAFKWWFLTWILIISVYLFTLLFTRKHSVAILLSIFMAASPFIQWWYQSITILPIAYSLLIVVLAVNLLEAKKLRNRILLGGGLSYLLACFAFIMYPAFQIATALVAFTVFTGVYFHKYSLKDLWKKRFIPLLCIPLILAIIPISLFYIQHHETIQSIQNTSYPGKRNVISGGAGLEQFVYWPANYTLRDGGPATPFGGNQSEASGFLLMGMILIPFLLFYFYRSKAKLKDKDMRKLFYVFAAILILLIIILARLYIPLGEPLYKLFGLHMVPHGRLMIAIGIINLVLIVIALSLPTKKIRKSLVGFLEKPALATSCFAFFIIAACLVVTKKVYGLSMVGPWEILAFSLALSSSAGLMAHSTKTIRTVGLVILVGITLFSSWLVNPLYRGLGSLEHSKAVNQIKQIEKQDNKRWITTNDMTLEALPLSAGAEVISGVNTYPQIFWTTYFPNKKDVFNRYAHVKFVIDDTSQRNITLTSLDSFLVTMPSCDPLIEELNIGYLVAYKNQGLQLKCFQPIRNSSKQSPIEIFKYRNP